MTELSVHLADEAAVAQWAQSLAPQLGQGGIIHLYGELGAGKTTFARALLQALGVQGRIKSPTYSLIESYAVDALAIHHLDLYRIADPGELEWLGLDELLGDHSLILIEWPERGGSELPAPDLILQLAHAPAGRDLVVRPLSAWGEAWLAATSPLLSTA
ncbi:tRNA threonylcarbamoyladenosine biosynthesis protein TsaE [Tahibacter aquaticus]|uniref:tRNA threonylcarbamoyladenosine biosynthesis protein TsaE n=1 Tax=Tahibacter aquaticus TaxID=520092 RepID=A0A4V3DM93_9GAMM|nr:tRNA (adenosine(37)-N6)-threonylcarbamoyltransferase complex ATPase subunit type 1 TsaE [Tahibacter aquaticus]TDR43299.1 tRNA threonylcarbamoyladenosine biosynthesis protein TsaE [Tahibacter aquaticus]